MSPFSSSKKGPFWQYEFIILPGSSIPSAAKRRSASSVSIVVSTPPKSKTMSFIIYVLFVWREDTYFSARWHNISTILLFLLLGDTKRAIFATA
jgi:hypothetical protein